jgi:hypothetical protein
MVTAWHIGIDAGLAAAKIYLDRRRSQSLKDQICYAVQDARRSNDEYASGFMEAWNRIMRRTARDD